MRHKYNKRKEAFLQSKKPPKRKLKEEKDKDVFKRRKFIKNVDVEKIEETEDQPSSSEDSEEESGYGKMVAIFGGNMMNKHAIESDSENSEDDEAVQEDSLERELEESEASDLQNDSDGEEEEGDGEEEEEEAEVNEDEEEEDPALQDDDNHGEAEEDEGAVGETDPFSAHFEIDIDGTLAESCQDRKKWKTESVTFPSLGNLQVNNLVVEQQSSKQKLLGCDDGDDQYLKYQKRLIAAHPEIRNQENLHLKKKLKDSLKENPSQMETELLSIMSDYKDLLYTERSSDNAGQLRHSYVLHVLNHVLKTRAKILNNNAKHDAREVGEEKLRDQGFTRPKVLILVPFKESCRVIVELMIELLFPGREKGSVANRKRFTEDYAKIETVRRDKPEDFYETFQGDINDSFKLGMAVTKKTLKLYTDFYSSDIIISSPLGLRLVTGTEAESANTDTDFLSSIELLIIDQADVLMMQNWDHVSSIINQLHQQPQQSHGVDFGRIRLWSLDGHSKFYRQSVIISSVPSPEINNIWNRNCLNYMGKVRVSNESPGVMGSVHCDLGVVLHQVTCENIQQSLEARFKYFTEKLMPKYKKDSMYHTCVFVSSYFDFVKVRNWFKSADLDCSEVSEYSKDKKIAEARDMFYHNEKHFLLYTERAHFYRRFRLKGIRHLIFYQPPTFGWMFSELCNLLQKSYQNPRGGRESNMSLSVLYTKYDAQRLSLCVGTDTAASLLASDKSVHVLQPGDN